MPQKTAANRITSYNVCYTKLLRHFEVIYYPIDLQIAVIDPQRRELLQTVTSREGRNNFV